MRINSFEEDPRCRPSKAYKPFSHTAFVSPQPKTSFVHYHDFHISYQLKVNNLCAHTDVWLADYTVPT